MLAGRVARTVLGYYVASMVAVGDAAGRPFVFMHKKE
jgi:hypothetical protein